MLKRTLTTCICALLLAGCNQPPPHNVKDICAIFKQYPEWYWAAKETQKKYGVPIPVQMAIIHQESSFRADAVPIDPKTKKPASSAYGYAQALVGTWKGYQENAKHYLLSLRSDFASASDFIGWYSQGAAHVLKISPQNAYQVYLAYHEGVGGYKAHSYANKAWLINVAKQVQSYSVMYAKQLQQCQDQIKDVSL